MTPRTAGYGHWSSAWSSDRAASASRDFAELRAGLGGVVWSEFDPADACTRLWHWTPAGLRCLTPTGWSVRSRVYEYGGGAFCLGEDGLVLVGEADQQLYWQDLHGQPQVLTQRCDCRYGDLCYDPLRRAVLAVEEQHTATAVVHRLVSIGRNDGAREVLAEGCDFYAAPTLSGDGQRLAWIEWDQPQQPWLATRLCVAQRALSGGWLPGRVVAGHDGDQSIQQPCFDKHHRLLALSDGNGYWQPWREGETGLLPLNCRPADHASAPWQLGACNYLVLSETHLLLSGFDGGFAWLAERDPQSGSERRLASEYSRFRQLAADQQHVYAIAASPQRGSVVLAIDRISHACQVLAGGECGLPAEDVSLPQRLLFLSGAGESCHGFFYPPHNRDFQAPEGEKPPLLVFLHGGPTSACYPVFDPRIQFWSQRGFAVVDLNYRGSSGYGRAYRLRLQGSWGEVEVEDAVAVLQHLAERGLVDPARAFIRGASAGGYTALCALAFTQVFRGGASLYGVSDPLALRRVTHKFEADYLDWLIGDPLLHAERYVARTPLLHAEHIQAPLIFFQGALDRVVVPEQTGQMVAALQRQGVEVECRIYANERHGFRQAKNLADVLDAELAFYRRLL
jgi:dipeptidyl aminopeptidase/acylaminoacyl peptidase